MTQVLDLPELDTPENEVQPGRWKNRELINARIGEKLSTNSQRYWLDQLEGARAPSN